MEGEIKVDDIININDVEEMINEYEDKVEDLNTIK